jgi:hypothetical protein
LAVGLAAKSTIDKVPLWAIVLAAYSNDVLRLGFRAVGLENSGTYYEDIKRGIIISIPANIPWSHGLLMTVVWSALAAVIVYLFHRDRRSAGMISLVVISHWFLDVIVHPPELPLLFNGSPLVGLGLWSTHQGRVISSFMEVGMLVGGLALYLVHRKKKPVLVDKTNE